MMEVIASSDLVMLDREGSVKVSLGIIFPNRLNPNKMAFDKFQMLKQDMKVGNYNSITVSPLSAYYSKKALKDPRVWQKLPAGTELSDDIYIICDGYHKWKAAHELLFQDIWAVIRHVAEEDAWPYFFRRQQIQGDFDPIEEAALFRTMMREHDLSRKDMVKKFNLTSEEYLKSRLGLLNVAKNVIPLYYEPPKNVLGVVPFELSTSHLRELSFLPKRDQKRVALMCLRRMWGVRELRAEIRRIKEGRGTRALSATVETPVAPPPPKTAIEKTLLEKLLPWKVKVLNYIQEQFSQGRRTGSAELTCVCERERSTIREFLREMVGEGILEVEETLKGTREYRKIYWPKEVLELPEEPEPEPEPKPEPEPEPKPDEEIFEEYGDLDEDEEEPTTLHEQMQAETPAPSPQVPQRIPEEPAPETRLVINRALLEPLLEQIIMKGTIEDFDLSQTEKIGDRWPDEKLIDEFNEAIATFNEGGFQSSLVYVMLKAAQLHIRADLDLEEI